MMTDLLSKKMDRTFIFAIVFFFVCEKCVQNIYVNFFQLIKAQSQLILSQKYFLRQMFFFSIYEHFMKLSNVFFQSI